MRRALGLGVLSLLWLVAAPASPDGPGPWAVPEEGSCVVTDSVSEDGAQDAVATSPAPGTTIDHASIGTLKSWLPAEVWALRDRVFFEGVTVRVGPCYRSYAPPAFFAEATDRFQGQTVLLDNGGIEEFTAGLPFHPDTIAPDDPSAGARWAWNTEHRYRAGGSFADRFQYTRLGPAGEHLEDYDASRMAAVLRHRADKHDDDYHSVNEDSIWVGTLRFRNHHQWGNGAACFMSRPYGADATPKRTDDHWIYLPRIRKVRRANAHAQEWDWLPYYGLGYRPHHYTWKLVGVVDVLAPINSDAPFYPTVEDRNFGPTGVSPFDDRVELRRAVVFEGTRRPGLGDERVSRHLVYADLETLFPLYHISYAADGELQHVTVRIGRWSEDRADYPPWPDDEERDVRVLDVAGSIRIEPLEGYRFEQWEAVAIPPKDSKLKRMTSLSGFGRR